MLPPTTPIWPSELLPCESDEKPKALPDCEPAPLFPPLLPPLKPNDELLPPPGELPLKLFPPGLPLELF
jgi:hypothetical protein